MFYYFNFVGKSHLTNFRGTKISHTEQNAQGNRPQVQILGEEVERVTHFKYLGTSIEEEGGMETDSEASGSRVDELEEMQWSVV